MVNTSSASSISPRRGGLNEKEYDLYPRLADVVGSNFCQIGADSTLRTAWSALSL